MSGQADRRDIGFCVHVTRSADGVFVHFKSPSGKAMGFNVDETSESNILGRETLHEWALAALDGHRDLVPLE